MPTLKPPDPNRRPSVKVRLNMPKFHIYMCINICNAVLSYLYCAMYILFHHRQLLCLLSLSMSYCCICLYCLYYVYLLKKNYCIIKQNSIYYNYLCRENCLSIINIGITFLAGMCLQFYHSCCLLSTTIVSCI